ncbi:MAG: argininosuccinate lyase [Kiritimatiellae bacterium]|nr:argininosuccinate lyase [Kiritimatiellia bacterium]
MKQGRKSAANHETITDRKVDPDILTYTVGEDTVLDLKLAVWDCMGTAAHATMLTRMKTNPPVLTRAEAEAVKKELSAIAVLALDGRFSIREDDQDVHMAVERMLTEKLGDLGKKIHTGRSRNDQVAVDVRLHVKDELLRMSEERMDLFDALVSFGRRHDRVPMAGRTHLQPAMPSSVGLWATGHAECLLRQSANFEATYAMNDVCPLGSAAGYGVPLPIDRELTSRLLGFAEPFHNVFGASMARGEVEASLVSSCAQTMCVLSRLAEDLILFSMPEFGYFRLPREYCTGSSIMPQKFNPDALELVRGKTAQVAGLLSASVGILHAMPGGYNRDLQDCKLLYMKALETTRTTLRIMTKVVRGLEIDERRLRAGFSPGVFATDAALRKVAQGMPWREAYHDVRDHLERLESEDPDAAVAAKTHLGATAGIDYARYGNISRERRAACRRLLNSFLACRRRLLGV